MALTLFYHGTLQQKLEMIPPGVQKNLLPFITLSVKFCLFIGSQFITNLNVAVVKLRGGIIDIEFQGFVSAPVFR
jgi:hypothetical protein